MFPNYINYFELGSTALTFVNRDPQSIATALKQMAEEGKDISAVRKALDEIEKQHDEHCKLTETLRNVAERAALAKNTRRFVIAYARPGGEIKTLYGLDYPGGIVVSDDDEPVSGFEDSMQELINTLSEAKISFSIAYID